MPPKPKQNNPSSAPSKPPPPPTPPRNYNVPKKMYTSTEENASSSSKSDPHEKHIYSVLDETTSTPRQQHEHSSKSCLSQPPQPNRLPLLESHEYSSLDDFNFPPAAPKSLPPSLSRYTWFHTDYENLKILGIKNVENLKLIFKEALKLIFDPKPNLTELKQVSESLTVVNQQEEQEIKSLQDFQTKLNIYYDDINNVFEHTLNRIMEIVCYKIMEVGHMLKDIQRENKKRNLSEEKLIYDEINILNSFNDQVNSRYKKLIERETVISEIEKLFEQYNTLRNCDETIGSDIIISQTKWFKGKRIEDLIKTWLDFYTYKTQTLDSPSQITKFDFQYFRILCKDLEIENLFDIPWFEHITYLKYLYFFLKKDVLTDDQFILINQLKNMPTVEIKKQENN